MANPQQLEDLAIGQAAVSGCIFGYVDTMALKCVVKLGIPDIISSHGHPISLVQIMDSINHSSQLATGRLGRVMTILVRRGIFTETPSESGDTVYGLTAASELLLSSSDKSFAALVASKCSEVFLPLWEHLGDYVKDGSNGFTKLYGMDAYSFLSARPELFADFQKNLAGVANIVMEAVKVGYLNYGLKGVGALVDVGGGYGAAIADIVKEFPQVKGINFDLPAVVAAAPEYPGVTHVAGDMFISIPSADAVMMKSVLHNWDDDTCVNILTNCRKAIPEETGKLILIEMVLDPYGNDPFDHTIVATDLLMLVNHSAQERTEGAWKKLLQRSGFSRYNIIKIPTSFSVIEAFP